MALYFQRHGLIDTVPGLSKFGVPYLSISVSLNVLLTLMIVIRLILHGRQIHTATGPAVGISGLYKTVSTMLIESCALFAVSSLVVIGALGVYENTTNEDVYLPGIYTVDIFFPILAETQVCAFPRQQSQGQFSNVTMDRAGDRFTAHYSTGRQPERVDEPRCHHWTRRFVQR